MYYQRRNGLRNIDGFLTTFFDSVFAAGPHASTPEELEAKRRRDQAVAAADARDRDIKVAQTLDPSVSIWPMLTEQATHGYDTTAAPEDRAAALPDDMVDTANLRIGLSPTYNATLAPVPAKSLLLSPAQVQAYMGPSSAVKAAPSTVKAAGPAPASTGVPWWLVATGAVTGAGATFAATKLTQNKKTGKIKRVPVNRFGQPMQAESGSAGTMLAIGTLGLVVVGLAGYAIFNKRKASKVRRRSRRAR